MSFATGHAIRQGHSVAERRSEPRQRVLKGAVLAFNRGFSTFECVVRNQSEHGARLSFAETFALPICFDVMIAGENGKRTARTRWRSMAAVGVEFD